MRAVVQRVTGCRVAVAGATIAGIESGLLVYIGVGRSDTGEDVDYLVEKILNLRIFPDEEGRMNVSALERRSDIMVVSQFTLYGDARRGRRPSYSEAAPAALAKALYQEFIAAIRKRVQTVASGEFQAAMDVTYTNSGPVTILLDSRRTF